MSSSPSSDDARLGSEQDVVSDGFIELTPNTHDTSYVSKHIPNLSDLTTDLEAATHAVWSRRHESRYSKVYALFMRWESDDLGVITESNDLQHVFQDLYYYQVESYKIPDERPDTSLKRRILQFLENDGKDTLLIVYYAGHAKKNQSNSAPIWHANRSPRSPSLSCGGIQSMLEEAHSDVLLLYDCCHSTATTASPSIGGYKGVTEVISACGYETMAPPVCEHSFSKAITQILASASQGQPFSVGELHVRVLNWLMCWTPRLVQDQERKFIRDLDGRLAYERQPRRTPIYTIICETEPRRSIILAPLKPPTSISKSSQISDNVRDSIAIPAKSLDRQKSPALKRKRSSEEGLNTSCDLKRQCSDEKDIEYPQVLLAIRLESDTFDQAAWLEWLRVAPPECKDVKIEGRYDSFSTLLLVRMPVATWNLLPENAAYSFVGFVTSENKACELVHLEIPTTCPDTNTETPLYDPRIKCEGENRNSPSWGPTQLAGSCKDEKGSSTEFQATASRASHIPFPQDFMIFNPNTIIDTHSPKLWNDNIIPKSHIPWPTQLEDWVLPPQQMMTSATNSPLNYSPSLKSLCPRYIRDFPDLVDFTPYLAGDRSMRKPAGARQSKVISDLASREPRIQGTSEASNESFRMVGRSSLEINNNARDHPLYQNIAPKADGLYHCPWEGQDGCMHKPQKLKCNYDKFIDVHLKPYRCKVVACENFRFTSTACLLRHEREAHGMHGHGDEPYLCTYEGCERGVAGNGFPRNWNLRDHMKRVHGAA